MKSILANRIPYIDIAKAIAITLVVTGHIIYFGIFSENTDEANQLFLYRFLQYVQMPLFIFCSGLVLKIKPMSVKEVSKDCYKRFRQLIIPMVVIGVIFTLVSNQPILDFVFKTMKLGYWYMLTLFELYILFYIFSIKDKYITQAKAKPATDILLMGGGNVLCFSGLQRCRPRRLCLAKPFEFKTIKNLNAILLRSLSTQEIQCDR